jgi:hypothetical protein
VTRVTRQATFLARGNHADILDGAGGFRAALFVLACATYEHCHIAVGRLEAAFLHSVTNGLAPLGNLVENAALVVFRGGGHESEA